MKKILSIILTMLLTFSLFVSCNNTNEKATDKKNTESKHTSHTIEKGKCSICGIDLFDELVKLVKEKNSNTSENTLKDSNTKTYSINYAKNSEITGQEYIWIESIQGKKHYYLTIRKGGVQTATYEWRYSDSTLTKFINIEGTLNPALLPSDSAFSLKTNVAVQNNQRETISESEMPFLGTPYSEMIQQTLVPLLRNSSTYLTPADYGFINY